MTTTSLLDDRTAAAIREALGAANAGRMDDACRIGDEAIKGGGDPAALNAMLGMLHCSSGNFDRGIDHLRQASNARPDDPVIALNLARALAQTGQHRDAFDVATEKMAEREPTMQLQRLRGILAQMLDEFATASKAYERVVAAYPNDWESWNNLGNARWAKGDAEGGLAALRRAAELNPHSPPIRLNLATTLVAAGLAQEAEEVLRDMARDFPQDTKPLRELHALLKTHGRDEDALDAIEAAVSRDPADLELLLGLASHQLMLLDTDAAEASYRQAIEREPANTLANLGLAVTYELSNRTEALSQLVGEAEKRGAPADALNFIRAFDHRRSKRFAEGLAALSKVPDELETARRCHLLGQLQDGAGDYDAAFEAFARMNAIQLADPSRPGERGTAYRNTLRSQRDTLNREWVQGWREIPAPDDRPAPVFLVGFPRSGTTLLDTMLMGHPRIEVLEEEPALHNATRMLPQWDQLPAATPQQVQEARDAYFETAGTLTPLAPGKLLVDKNPLSMNALPVIRRLFPAARIILALRHPADVVLSCFITNFKLNDGMASFLQLDTTAELYDLSFGNFERARELLEMPVHTVAYEDVVSDRERELRGLLDFLELDWSDEVLDHEGTARSRGQIKTASYAQVGQPLYRESSGRWQNYREHLGPVLPVLRPWAEKFGYAI